MLRVAGCVNCESQLRCEGDPIPVSIATRRSVWYSARFYQPWRVIETRTGSLLLKSRVSPLIVPVCTDAPMQQFSPSTEGACHASMSRVITLYQKT
jgi:hypothetical protein